MIYAIKHGACPQCKHKYRGDDDEPCVNCCHHYDDKFEEEGEEKMDYSYEEIIKDLKEVKTMFAEESEGSYPECLDYAIQAIEFISRDYPKTFESYIKGEEE